MLNSWTKIRVWFQVFAAVQIRSLVFWDVTQQLVCINYQSTLIKISEQKMRVTEKALKKRLETFKC